MKRRLRCLIGLILVFLCATVTVGSRPLHGQTVVATVPVGSRPLGVCVNPSTNHVYVVNAGNDNVSVIDGATNKVIATVPTGFTPNDVCVNPNTNRVYVVNWDNDNVSVIDGATNQVIATVPVGKNPRGVAVNPNTNRVYVANADNNNVSVIDGATNQVIATIKVGDIPFDGVGFGLFTAAFKVGKLGVCVNPSTNRVYVTNADSNNVSVIDGATNKVIATVPVGSSPLGVCVNPNTNRVYVTNDNIGKVSVIDGATNQVIAMVPVENHPRGVCVNPNTNRVYVSNLESNTVSVIDGAATNPVSKRRDEFIKKNGVEEWPDISELSANPFVYEGQTIAIQTNFETMQASTQGIFVVGDAPIIVSDIPKGMFKEEGLIVVLAGKVIGKTELQLPFLGLMQVPHLKFVGVHFCQDKNCNDIIPEEASLKKATHASEDRKTHSKESHKELTAEETLEQEQEETNAIEEAKKQQIISLHKEILKDLEKRDFNAALQRCKKSIEIDTEDYFAYANLGCAYAMLNEFDLSIEYSAKASNLRPELPGSYIQIVYAYARKGDKDLAFEVLLKAVDRGFKDIDYLRNDTDLPDDFRKDTRFKGLLAILTFKKLISGVKDAELFSTHSQVFPYRYDEVWDVINYHLKKEKENITQSDKETGIIVTDTIDFLFDYNDRMFNVIEKYYIFIERINEVSSKVNLKLITYYFYKKDEIVKPRDKYEANSTALGFLKRLEKRFKKNK